MEYCIVIELLNFNYFIFCIYYRVENSTKIEYIKKTLCTNLL